MRIDGCLSCDTLSGKFCPPGGIVYENDCWLVVLRARPLRFPCYPFILLKRHCEHVQELTNQETALLGPTMKLTAQVLVEVIKPAKVYFGIYGEGVKHIHVHVFPRMASMPAGNIPNIWLDQWYQMFQFIRLKKPYNDNAVAHVAKQLRDVYQQFGLEDKR
jgi:diadenosine tetraphosphate (Ap4A) HIT family hydrolase